MSGNSEVKIAFLCVENAGRSQIAAALAAVECEKRNLDVEIVSGGTEPADHVHDNVVKALQEIGIDIRDEKPQSIGVSDLKNSDIVITMGCSAENVCPANLYGEDRDWDLRDPGNADLADTREIRENIKQKVEKLFDEIEDNYGFK